MEKNYLFQNYGYVDGPVNMKHVVIDLLRAFGIFIHMRDEPSCIYDMDKFLHEKSTMGIPYHKENIENCRRLIKKSQEKIDDLRSDHAEALYRKYYTESERYYNEAIATNRSYHKWMDRAEKSKGRIKLIEDFINRFDIEGQEELTEAVKDNLQRCINALSEDYKMDVDQATENDVRGKSCERFNPLKKEDWVASEIKRSEEAIKLYKKRIKEEQESIKKLKERDEAIKALFKALEPFDKEVE